MTIHLIAYFIGILFTASALATLFVHFRDKKTKKQKEIEQSKMEIIDNNINDK